MAVVGATVGDDVAAASAGAGVAVAFRAADGNAVAITSFTLAFECSYANYHVQK